MTTIARQLAAEHPRTNERVGAVVVPLRDEIVGDTRIALFALLGAAGCVLLIACIDVANLLLARLSSRRQELAVRAAIGAGWSRIVAQLVMESLVLAGLGAVTGLLMSRAGMGVLEKLIPVGIVETGLTIDWPVLEFSDRSESMRLLEIFAGLALALAAIGIYGVLAYSVSQRTREIGVRMALGATTTGVYGMVLRQGMGLVAAGLCTGIAGALAAGRVLSRMLFGVAPTDIVITMTVALGLAAVAAVACWIPARRAASIDPLLALREE